MPSIAGPKRPQDRVSLTESKSALPDGAGGLCCPTRTDEDEAVDGQLPGVRSRSRPTSPTASATRPAAAPAARRSPTRQQARAPVTLEDGTETELDHGHVVIAAITSCTNTSNPSVMLGAGILARNAVQKGLKVKPWVKTSLAPGSKVVTEYLERAGLTEYLEALGFNLVGYGCTTCIGNSGPLPEEISDVVNAEDLAVVSVLSGNRNFEGRINPDVKMNYLASPPLCVAYALAGTMDIDLYDEPLGEDEHGEPVFLKDIWPDAAGGRRDDRGGRPVGHVPQELRRGVRRRRALELARGAHRGRLRVGRAIRPTCAGRRSSRTCPREPEPIADIEDARVLAVLGDSVTTDHISPAGSIKRDGPAGKYLIEHGVEPRDFNSYGSRRGNHEVMMRGTFANIRLRNQLAPGTEGGVTLYLGRRRRARRCRSTTRRCATSTRARPADRPGRQGVRLGLVARLGGQGHAPARRPRGDRRELRAHPPLQPGRHGRAAAPVQGRRVGRARWA